MFNEVVDGQRLCPPLKLSYEEEVRIRKGITPEKPGLIFGARRTEKFQVLRKSYTRSS